MPAAQPGGRGGPASGWHRGRRGLEHVPGDEGETSLTFTLPAQGEWCLLTKTVDEDHANPLKVWHDLGEPRQLTAAQTALLQESAQPLVATQRLTAEDGQLSFTLRLKEDAVVSFQLLPAAFQGDRGYDYRRAVVG